MAEKLDFSSLWTPTAKNKLLRANPARNRLRVGGAGSSKSSDAMWEVVSTLLQWEGVYGLILRRTMADLKKSNIPDFFRYIPNNLFQWNASENVATFYNGSRLYFGHCQNFSEKDLAAFQSASFPVIFIDECANIPGHVWTWLQTRNRINPQCKPNKNGQYPKPFMLGACNPMGIGWSWFHDMFVLKRPRDLPKDAKGPDKNGRYWLPKAGNGFHPYPVYDPHQWAFIHSTVYDNPHLLEKDPGYVAELMAKPERERKKLLDGVMEAVGGQYYDCFDPDFDVVDLRKDPDAIQWQTWQPRWLGWDWGRGHFNACYWFTLAMVRRGDKYRLTTVCYREYVDRGQDYITIADEIKRLTSLGLPGSGEGTDLQRIYFSHEKFARQMEEQSPAAKLSGYLMDKGLPPVTGATRDRVGRAQLFYHMLYRRELVVLSICPEIIAAIPQLAPDEKNIEDVLKIDGKADDVYDGFTYGLFGELGKQSMPKEERDRQRVLGTKDDFQRMLLQYKLTKEREKQLEQAGLRTPDWMTSPVIRDRDW